MNKILKWKIALLVVTVLFCGMTIAPSFIKDVPQWWKKYLAPEGLRLGLDLQGGMHLVLKVDLDKAIENTLDFAAHGLKEALEEKQITVVRTPSAAHHTVTFTLPNTGATATVREVVAGDFPNLAIQVIEDPGVFPRIVLSLTTEQVDFINDNAVNQSLEIIRNRIDQFGVAEPVIIRQGTDEIVVQLPGVKDPKRAMELLGQTAQLEFKLVNDEAGIDLQQLINQAVQAGQWKEGQDRKILNMALQQQLPADSEIYFKKEKDPKTHIENLEPMLIKSQILLTGDMVKNAQVRVGGNFNEPYVSLDLTSAGGKIFGQVTTNNVNRQLAIVLDEVVKSAPVIREKILGGSAQISGSFTYDEASDLAIVLRVGALPAPVSIIQNLTVGASLGQDSMHKGFMSGLIGTLLVLVFMAFYYRLSGVIANVGMVLNVLLLFSGLAMLNATLTLPGIAGIILSIGMAVDSNIIIFERMREEFALGKTVRSGVEGGYDKAFWTIVDAHITTLITSMALFLFGTGPIKGFAVTLSLGVVFNLFTTLFGTRLVYDVLYDRRLLKPLNFLQVMKKPNLDYMKVRKFTFAVSGVLALLGLIAFVQILRGHANLGVDFAGGMMNQYKATQPFDLKDVRKVFADNTLEGLELQQVEDENRLIVRMKKSEEVVGDISARVSNLLTEQLPEKGFSLESQADIGSSVSKALRNNAILAIFLSFLGVVCYLAFRFNLHFGWAAAIATLHDVLVVLGICWLLNVEITLLLVTALLTLAGYSLNDTVIIFDRLRENINKLGSNYDLIKVINNSVNEVLGRTISTSFTVFLVLVALFFAGGAVIHDFSFVLLIGVVVGTYSSIFIASPILDLWRQKS